MTDSGQSNSVETHTIVRGEPRAKCNACGRGIRLTDDGRLWQHGVLSRPIVTCPGSWRRPADLAGEPYEEDRVIA